LGDSADGTGPGGVSILHAYDAINVATELFNSTQNAARDGLTVANKFATPTITNGKVYVGSQKALSVFGVLPRRPLRKGSLNEYSYCAAFRCLWKAFVKVGPEFIQQTAAAP